MLLSLALLSLLQVQLATKLNRILPGQAEINKALAWRQNRAVPSTCDLLERRSPYKNASERNAMSKQNVGNILLKHAVIFGHFQFCAGQFDGLNQSCQ